MLRRWLTAFVIIGVALRLFRYGLGLPFWGDEGFLGVNILDRSYLGLLKPLEYIQVAPLGFLWAERAMYQALGMSEYVMRLIPVLAGIGGLILFAMWARKIADPLAATIATGVLAVSDEAIRHSAELKPYSIDLFISVLLLYLATRFLLDRKNQWLIALIAVIPVALFISLPSVFVGAGVAATLVLNFRSFTALQRALSLGFGVVLTAVFGLLVWKYLGPQFAGSGPWQQVCWVFPPLNPFQFINWFIIVHTGNYFGYPADSGSPGGAPSFILFVIGGIILVMRRPRAWPAGAFALCDDVSGGGAAALSLWRQPAHRPARGRADLPAHRRRSRRDHPPIRKNARNPAPHLPRGVLGADRLRMRGNHRHGFFPDQRGSPRPGHPAVYPRRPASRPADTTIAVVEGADQSPILERWYLHEWPHAIHWAVNPVDLPSMTSGPLWIVNARFFPEQWARQISAQIGPPRQDIYQSFGGDEGICEILIYSTPS